MTYPADWADAMRRERDAAHLARESVVAQDADEARSARHHEPAWRDQRRVGSAWVEDPDLPEWDEPA